jgi:hypothetical protein
VLTLAQKQAPDLALAGFLVNSWQLVQRPLWSGQQKIALMCSCLYWMELYYHLFHYLMICQFLWQQPVPIHMMWSPYHLPLTSVDIYQNSICPRRPNLVPPPHYWRRLGVQMQSLTMVIFLRLMIEVVDG